MAQTNRLANTVGATIAAIAALAATTITQRAEAQEGPRQINALAVVATDGYPTRDGLVCLQRDGLKFSMINSPANGDVVSVHSGSDHFIRLVDRPGYQLIGRLNGQRFDNSRPAFGSGPAPTIQALESAAPTFAARADKLCEAAFDRVKGLNFAFTISLPPVGSFFDQRLIPANPQLIQIGPAQADEKNQLLIYSAGPPKVARGRNPGDMVYAYAWDYLTGGTAVLGEPPPRADQMDVVRRGEGAGPVAAPLALH